MAKNTSVDRRNKLVSPERWWAAFISIFLVEALLITKLITSETSGELLIAISVLAVLLVLSPRIADLISITLTKEGLEAKLANIEEGLSDAQAKIEANKKRIDKLFLLAMSSEMYNNLKKLASGEFGKFEKSKNGGLEKELYLLRSANYIEVQSIQAIPERGSNLSDYVKVTPTSQEFVALREQITNPNNL